MHRDAIRANDEIAVAAKVLAGPGDARVACDLTGPAALSFFDLAKILTRELGREIGYRPRNPAAFSAARVRAGDPPMMALVMTGLYIVRRLDKGTAVTDAVHRLLLRPATPLDSYVHRAGALFGKT